MTAIIPIDDPRKLPQSAQVYMVANGQEEVAIDKFQARYGYAPDQAYRWKNYLYVPVREE